MVDLQPQGPGQGDTAQRGEEKPAWASSSRPPGWCPSSLCRGEDSEHCPPRLCQKDQGGVPGAVPNLVCSELLTATPSETVKTQP